jgi:hypothetical protein
MPVRTFVRRTLPLTGDNGRLLKNVLSSASGAVDKVAYYIPPRDATAFLRKVSSRCLGCVGRIARGWARKANCEPERKRGIVIDTGRRSRRAGWRRPGRDPPAGIGDRAPERRTARDDHRGGIDACPVSPGAAIWRHHQLMRDLPPERWQHDMRPKGGRTDP